VCGKDAGVLSGVRKQDFAAGNNECNPENAQRPGQRLHKNIRGGNAMKNAALYLVGARENDGRESRLREYGKEKSYKTIGAFIDEDPDDRSQFQRLLQEASEKRFEAVVIQSLDQLAPSPGLQIEAILKLSEVGIGILSFVEDLDTSQPEGKAFLLRRIKQMESKLTPLPKPSTPGRKNRPGRKAADFNDDKGVRMRLEEEKSYTEIGTAMDVSKSTAHNRITRAILKRLKLSLGDH